jgi:transcriptional regulator with XRE-family HTH domain
MANTLASKEGVVLLKNKKFELNLTFKEIADNAGLASVDQVKRLFNPQWNRRVQRDTIDRIARVLNLDPADIIATGDSEHYG